MLSIPLAMISTTIMLNWVFFIVYVVVVVSCIIVVLSENRNPIRSMAWVIALIFMPVVGLIFYAFFGRGLRGMNLISRHNKRKLMNDSHPEKIDLQKLGLSNGCKQLVKLCYGLSKYPLTVNNAFKIYTDAHSKFDDFKSDLLNAKLSIFVQYYIFQDDKLGNEIADILLKKAAEGVDVKVLYDHIGSFSARNKFFERMRKGGIETHPFFKVTFPHLANRINWRNHRKVTVIDGRIGYIGGMNIADRYIETGSNGRIWRDTHIRVEGGIVESLMYSFAIDWNFLSKNPETFPSCAIPENLKNEVGMELCTSGPMSRWNNLTLCFLQAISNARHSIYIQTPYFLPTDSLLQALQVAALAKVDVRIMIPEKSDSKMLSLASYSYITQCLKSGIKVYLYKPGMLHAKMMVVDHDFTTIGSTNFDFRSFENNFEANLMIYDEKFNGDMRDIFFKDIEDCKRLTYTEWHQRPRIQRSFESCLRLMAPVL